MIPTTWACIVSLSLMGAAWAESGSAELSDDSKAFYHKQVEPILEKYCFSCHSMSDGKGEAHLFLDSWEGILRGGISGPALIAGKAKQSLIIQAVHQESAELSMPPKKRLPDQDIATLETWINEYQAYAPPLAANAKLPEVEKFDLEARRDAHWCWQPVQNHQAPSSPNPQYNTNAIDQWIDAKLREHELTPSPKASKRELVRRVSYDLTGLPPTPSEIDSFLTDDTPEALASLIDRFMSKPAFGEKWAQHWLDLMRYAESYGHEFDFSIHNAWKYRDYLIRAFNQDIPYDQLVREHLMGDIIEQPRIDQASGTNESIIGTAGIWLGDQTHSPVDSKGAEALRIDNKIDVVSKTFQSLTIACAKCHDHKFDAISHADYHALYGIFESTRYGLNPTKSPELLESEVQSILKAQKQLNIDINKLGTHPSPPLDPAKSIPASGPQATELALPTPNDDKGWSTDSLPPRSLVVEANEYLAYDSPQGPKLIQSSAAGIDTRKLGLNHELILRSPTFPVKNRYVHVLIDGTESNAYLVLNGFKLIRDPIYGKLVKKLTTKDNKGLHWVTFDLEGTWMHGKRHQDGIHHAYLEFSDSKVLGPALGGLKTQIHQNLRGHFQIYQVLLTNVRQPPSSPSSFLTEHGTKLNTLYHNRQLPVSSLHHVIANQSTQTDTEWMIGSAEGTGKDSPIFLRGNHHSLGQTVQRRYLEAFVGQTPAELDTNESGRRYLTEQILSPDNSLTYRVITNRLWHHLFGHGIVRTVDNFGVLGDEPSHPELLDHLANQFVRDGMSIKTMIRTIMLTETYQQSSVPMNQDAEAKDPTNQWVHRQNRRRLTAEVIRDSMLELTGTMDATLYGPPVDIHLTPFMSGRGKPAQGTIDGKNRRSIYLSVRRNFMSPFLLSFDRPTPVSTVGRRNMTNVPSQALIMMNDPFVHQLSERFATKLLSHGEIQNNQERLNLAFELALGRPIQPLEEEAYLNYLAGHHGSPQERWTAVAHTIFNLKEFIYIP
ncbi:PSD1 and planctomycete cytochrome C domain-containing protein [Rubritalea marina]|uniref:PSD1 and planctomycete cytochrome C domain-containing protein n=1 Tax=Rubritalea marina TaxID=361055 RepID=UPI001461541C|nr:PSD1 and planctomycete cytochrome C domain-containing protein [Rubritalea marina]